MRILIASDIHGSIKYARRVAELMEIEKADRLLLLGDLYYHGPRNPLPEEYDPKEVANLFNSIKDKLMVVKGNCDAEVDEMISDFNLEAEIRMKIGNKRFFFTHGHHINKDKLPEDTDVLVYGHFHTGFIEEVDGIICMNPGSTTLPKNDTPHSYGIIDDGLLQVKKLNGDVIFQKNIE